MSNRHLARSIVLQTLFETDFAEQDPKKLLAALYRTRDEYGPGINENDFMERLVKGVREKQKDLDTIITKAAPDWPIDKISPIDRNVLRLGLFELLFSDRKDVPAKVAINEAIELAKSFGGDSSGRFVNGVLGSVYKEIGEPGKNEVSKKKIPDVPFEKMPIENLGGAVVYARHDGDVYVALVHDVFGHWTLSKGKIEVDDVREGTVLKLKEELGLDVTLHDDLGSNEYVASHPEKGKTRKQVHYFLAEAPFHEITLGSSGGLDDARWFKLAEIVNLNIYDDILPIITKAINILVAKK